MEFLKILAFIAFAIMAVRWLTSLLNLVTGTPALSGSSKKEGEISVLIPARNEAHNLPVILQSLRRCDDSVKEILVYNDQSEDETAAVVTLWARYDNRIQLIEGKGISTGWLGKNHACHQLANRANGDYLLFLDADVSVNQKAIDLALSNMKNNRLALFSFFPRQDMRTLGEWLLVAQVNIILISLLPLAISRYIPMTLMTAANGQFMLFDGVTYRKHRFHEKLKHQAVEDVAIAQFIKKKGLNVRTALAPEGLKCRMYQGYHEARMGLARSARFFFGGSILTGWMYVFFSSLGWLLVLFTLPPFGVLAYFLLLFSMRIFISLASGVPPIKNLVLMPFQQIALIHLFYTATKQLILKQTIWKGRPI